MSLGYGFIPSAELVRQLGGAVTVDPQNGFPVPLAGMSEGVLGPVPALGSARI